MSDDTIIKIKSKWLPDISESLCDSLISNYILEIEKSSTRNNGFLRYPITKIDINYLNTNIKTNWIKLNDCIYSIKHFRHNYHILDTYGLSFVMTNSVSFHPDLEYSIFCIYILIYCLINEIKIVSYYDVDASTIIISSSENTIKCYQGFYKQEKLILEIICDDFLIKQIHRDSYLIYDVVTQNLNYYTIPIKENCGIFQLQELKNNEMFQETIKPLPISILFKFIKSCYFLLQRYPYLERYKDKNQKTIKLIWYNNYRIQDKFCLENINTSGFSIVIIADSHKQFFYCYIIYISVFIKLSPFINKIRFYFEKISDTSNKLLLESIKPDIEKPVSFIKNLSFYDLFLVGIFISSLCLKHLISFKRDNNYDNIKLTIDCDSTDELLKKFSKIYMKQNFYYPFIVIWGSQNPSLFMYQKKSCLLNVYIVLLIENFYKNSSKYNFISENIINVRILPNYDDIWMTDFNVTKIDDSFKKKQYLLFKQYKNKIEIQGKCNLFVRKILDSIKQNI